MKKVIAGISILMIAAFAVIFTVNAQANQQDTKKTSNEATSKDCKKGPNGSPCCQMKYGSTADNSGSAQGKCGEKSATHSCCKEAKEGHDCCKSAGTASADGKKCDSQCTKTAPAK